MRSGLSYLNYFFKRPYGLVVKVEISPDELPLRKNFKARLLGVVVIDRIHWKQHSRQICIKEEDVISQKNFTLRPMEDVGKNIYQKTMHYR
jgi:hypothetical protein